MNTMLDTNAFGLAPGIQYTSEQDGPPIVCFRCGECCARYQVLLSLMEAQRIADDLDCTPMFGQVRLGGSGGVARYSPE